MKRLPNMICPKCGNPVTPRSYVPNARGAAPPARNYAGCLRRCEACGIGFSNARHDPTIIYRDPLDNLPKPVRGGTLDTLAQALNVANRSNKLAKFGFGTSEDAVTWTVFNYLLESQQLVETLARLTPLSAQRSLNPTLLLWGVPLPLRATRAVELRDSLVGILDGLGEVPEYRSEPDVIIDLGADGLIIVEVKVHSGPDTQTDRAHWETYLGSGCFVDKAKARASGFYELVRYWRIGWELANERPFCLASLGPPRLYAGNRRQQRLSLLRESLGAREDRCFAIMDWRDFLAPVIPLSSPWFRQYVDRHGLRSSR